jgi:hypothetical protein
MEYHIEKLSDLIKSRCDDVACLHVERNHLVGCSYIIDYRYALYLKKVDDNTRTHDKIAHLVHHIKIQNQVLV